MPNDTLYPGTLLTCCLIAPAGVLRFLRQVTLLQGHGPNSNLNLPVTLFRLPYKGLLDQRNCYQMKHSFTLSSEQTMKAIVCIARSVGQTTICRYYMKLLCPDSSPENRSEYFGLASRFSILPNTVFSRCTVWGLLASL